MPLVWAEKHSTSANLFRCDTTITQANYNHFTTSPIIIMLTLPASSRGGKTFLRLRNQLFPFTAPTRSQSGVAARADSGANKGSRTTLNFQVEPGTAVII